MGRSTSTAITSLLFASILLLSAASCRTRASEAGYAASEAASSEQSDGRQASKPPPQRKRDKGRGQSYTIEQATSDNAQLHTIAFSCVAFLTGDGGSDSFLPPGKVCDYFGFQYLRDVDQQGQGHNTDFLTRAAGNVLACLSDEQIDMLVALAAEQAPGYERLAMERFPLMQAFRENLGQSGKHAGVLDCAAVSDYSAGLYALDMKLSLRRAEVLGGIVRSLNHEQHAALDSLKAGRSSTWPEQEERRQLSRDHLPHREKVLVMTYASELLSWYLGDVEADTYFCPERHGTYFGGFYLKDAPAMGKRNYSISTALTADLGQELLGLLNPDQQAILEQVVEEQRSELQEIVELRRQVAQELRRNIDGRSPDAGLLDELARRYGELDGRMSCRYAAAFAQLLHSMDSGQIKALRELRALEGTPNGAFCYSEAIALPSMADTSMFFKGA